MLNPKLVEQVLGDLWQEHSKDPGVFTIELAWKLLAIGRQIGVDPADLEQLDEFRANLETFRTRGLTPKNKALLRQVTSPKILTSIVNLPDQLMRQARQLQEHAPVKAAIKAQTAIAIAILTFAPVRLGNLGRIRLGENLIKPAGTDEPYWLVFPDHDVKNNVPLELALDRRLTNLIDEYVYDFRPSLIRGSNQPWLFPAKGHGHKMLASLGQQITDRVLEATGVRMTAHQFRHTAAVTYLKQRPGEYETVRRLLGHRNLTTTTRFYTGLETTQANSTGTSCGGSSSLFRRRPEQMPALPRSLPMQDWPPADRLAWEHECRDGLRLRRDGRASHMRPVTRDDLAKRYGLLQDFVHRSHRLDQTAAAGAHVTPENVKEFIAELRERVSSVTLHGSIYKLRRATEIIAPEHELAWLQELEKDLEIAKQPKSQMHRLVLAEVILQAGLTLMIEADAAEHRTAIQRATQYRNGLMIALLACCPIRLKNFAALAIGSSIVQIDDSWWIVLTAEQTKENRPDERRVPTFVSPNLNRYISEHRAALARAERSSQALWLSQNGEPMTYLGVEGTITRTTTETTGVPVSPHMFRMSAATTAAIHAGSTPRLASAILDHRDETTTQQHYNRATSFTAAARYREIVSGYLAGK